uniref:Putative secreted protein n=1 Tax=Anopheles triannulatus TaxID=58253 RepID=A0A2M4B4F8_9DIPT
MSSPVAGTLALCVNDAHAHCPLGSFHSPLPTATPPSPLSSITIHHRANSARTEERAVVRVSVEGPSSLRRGARRRSRRGSGGFPFCLFVFVATNTNTKSNTLVC